MRCSSMNEQRIIYFLTLFKGMKTFFYVKYGNNN